MIQRFTVQRFQADGGFTFGGAMLLVLSTFAVGAALGALASFIGQWFYLVGVFPVFIGLGVGGVAAWAIRRGHVRNCLIAGFSAFLAGCVAMLVMHYVDYLQFQSTMRQELDKLPPEVAKLFSNMPEVLANLDKQPPHVQFIVGAIKQEPLGLEAWLVRDFPGYMQLEAHSGVRIGRPAEVNRDPKTGMNLGYIGSYIYWGVEVLIVAGIAFAMAAGKSREPYCTQCDTWKESRMLGSVLPPAETAVDALGQGDLNLLRENHPNCDIGELMVHAHVCPKCGEQSPIDVKMEHVTKNSKGVEKRKQLTHVTYPGNALAPLATMFSTPPPVAGAPQSPTA